MFAVVLKVLDIASSKVQSDLKGDAFLPLPELFWSELPPVLGLPIEHNFAEKYT